MNYYLKFAISDINFAAPIEEIKEIARPKSILKQEKKDKGAKNLIGFFHLRKEKLLLYDLPSFLEIRRNKNNKFEVIVSEIHNSRVGFKVDKVFGIITADDLISVPELARPKDYFRGVIREGESVVQVLSLTKLMSGSRLKSLKKYL